MRKLKKVLSSIASKREGESGLVGRAHGYQYDGHVLNFPLRHIQQKAFGKLWTLTCCYMDQSVWHWRSRLLHIITQTLRPTSASIAKSSQVTGRKWKSLPTPTTAASFLVTLYASHWLKLTLADECTVTGNLRFESATTYLQLFLLMYPSCSLYLFANLTSSMRDMYFTYRTLKNGICIKDLRVHVIYANKKFEIFSCTFTSQFLG